MFISLRKELKRNSPLHYAATLFSPEAKRDALVTLYAFDFEIKRIPALVSEPMLGQIRLQWWRDVVTGERAAEAKLNPLSESLLDLIDRGDLPRQGLLNLIEGEAQVFDPAPRIDEAALEAFYGLRFASLFQLASVVLDPSSARHLSDASGHAGMAYGIARDLLSGRHAVTRADLVALGESHLQKARAAIAQLPDGVRAAFLAMVIVEPVLLHAKRVSASQPIAIPSYFNILWRMLRFKI